MDESLTGEHKQFRIEDDATANWAFQKLSELDSEKEKQLEQYQIFVSQNEEWKKREVGKLDSDIERMQYLIEEYRLTKSDGKINVPAGKTILRHSKVVEYDEPNLIQFVEANYPDYITTKSSVKKGELKKTLTATNGNFIDGNGQIVTGMTYTEQESVSFKTN